MKNGKIFKKEVKMKKILTVWEKIKKAIFKGGLLKWTG